MRQVICWFVYIGKNSRFTAFLDSNLHTRQAIVTENELGLAFPPRNLPKKFRPDPSTFYLVIMVTNKQTDRQTNAGDYIIPRESFRGDKNTVQNRLTSFNSQEALLSPRDRAMHRVSWTLANCHATMQKLLVRQVLNKSKLQSWRVMVGRCVINMCTQPWHVRVTFIVL